MKRLYTFLSVLCVTVVMLMLSSCSGRDYRDTLPAETTAVVAVNPQSFADKAGVGDFTQSAYYQMAQMLLAEQQMSAEERDYLLQLIAHPGTSGLDVEKDVYLFVGKDENSDLSMPEVGLLFKVKNPKEMKTFFDWCAAGLELQPQTEKGVTFLSIDGVNNATCLAYTKESFLIYTEQAADPEEVKATMMQLLSQKKAESLMGKPEIASVLNTANDMQRMFNYGPLMKMSGMQMQLPGFDFVSKMYYVAATNFEAGKIVTDYQILFCDKEAEKQFLALGSMFPEKLSGNTLALLPQTNMALLAVTLQGEKIYEVLEQSPLYGMAFSSVPQAAPILKSIAGDFTVAFHGMLPGGKMPALSMLVELRDAADMQTLMEMFPAGYYTQTAPNQYMLNEFPLYFGLNGKTLYATTDSAALDYLTGKSTSDYKAGVEPLFRDAYAVIKIDLVQLRDMLAQMVANGEIEPQFGMALPYLALFESIDYTGKSNASGSLVINMTDKEKNAAAVLYATIEDVVQLVAGMGL